MKIIVTAGGTAEPIDAVRTIANQATGRLGSLIADAFGACDAVETVFYICARDAVLPTTEKAVIIKIGDTKSLQDAMTRVLTLHKIDACVHSMAVSDYAVYSATTVGEIAQSFVIKKDDFGDDLSVQDALQSAVENAKNLKNNGEKLRSDIDDLVLVMRRTPKIIASVKDLSPETLLVGFKLLDNVSKDVLLAAAFHLLEKNHCEFVLANDISEISGSRHVGYVMDKQKQTLRYETKTEIAQGIAEKVLRKLRDGL